METGNEAGRSPSSSPGDAMKKKFTRIESQSSSRTLVIGASMRSPATSKLTRSPA